MEEVFETQNEYEEDDDVFFPDLCEEKGIKIIYGRPHKYCDSDILVVSPQCLIDYCEAKGIHVIMLEYRENTSKEVDINKLKNELKKELTDYYNRAIVRYPLCVLPSNAEKDCYLPVLDRILEELENSIMEKDSTDEDEEELLDHVEAWVFDNGIRLHACLFDAEDDEKTEGKRLSKSKLYYEYTQKLRDQLLKRKQEIEIECENKIREKKDAVINEIKEVIKGNKKLLLSLNTQKGRNEFADRIYIIWQQERGADWLTKKEVRSIVELEYVHLTEG